MTMTILITTGVCVTFFTLLNQIAQRSHLTLQDQRDDLLAATQWAADIIQRPEDMWDEEGLPTEEMERFAAFLDRVLTKAGGAK